MKTIHTVTPIPILKITQDEVNELETYGFRYRTFDDCSMKYLAMWVIDLVDPEAVCKIFQTILKRTDPLDYPFLSIEGCKIGDEMARHEDFSGSGWIITREGYKEVTLHRALLLLVSKMAQDKTNPPITESLNFTVDDIMDTIESQIDRDTGFESIQTKEENDRLEWLKSITEDDVTDWFCHKRNGRFMEERLTELGWEVIDTYIDRMYKEAMLAKEEEENAEQETK